VREYLGALADTYGLPAGLVHAVARTESNFDTRHTLPKPAASRDICGPDNSAYGVMQVRDDQIGRTVPAPNDSAYKISHNIKTDWKANARAGVALLAQQYQLATLENPFGSEQEHAQEAYAGYSGGAAHRNRYLQTLPYRDQPAHPDHRPFL
jgi:soluble lytic murein transglycosylase-like protein